jgi:hypothetical protein
VLDFVDTADAGFPSAGFGDLAVGDTFFPSLVGADLVDTDELSFVVFEVEGGF